MRKLFAAISHLLLLCCFAPGAAAQTSGLDFLNIGPNTLSLGLNEAHTATLVGASALYSNPANLALEPSSSLSASHTLWIGNLQNSHVAVNLKNNRRSIAFGVLASIADDFEARGNSPGPSQGTFSVSYYSVAGAYALRIQNFSIGVTAQYLREEFLINDASGYGFNAGVSSEWLNRRLRVSAALLNVGKMEKLALEATELPTSLKGGLYFEVFRFLFPGNEDLPILAAIHTDYNKPLEKKIDDQFVTYDPGAGFVNAGLSFEIAEIVNLYTGYKTGNNERNLSFGAGLNLQSIRFNYAMVPFSSGFGTVHSIGFQYYF